MTPTSVVMKNLEVSQDTHIHGMLYTANIDIVEN
jgi:hypothetical protein